MLKDVERGDRSGSETDGRSVDQSSWAGDAFCRFSAL